VKEYYTLIQPSALKANSNNPNWVIIDCRFNLNDTNYGRNEYKKGHIPGAMYAHLDEDLSGPVIQGETGRHPLPDIENLCQKLGSWGIDNRSQVVVYDDKFGAIAARLWWLLRFLNHKKVAVLNGAWQGWLKLKYPTQTKEPKPEIKKFVPDIQESMKIDTDFIQENIQTKKDILIDSRASERYLGKVEPIDPIAGHIPGAINLPFAENIDDCGKFLPKEKLITRFSGQHIAREKPPIFYCGSGVTACHNILAYTHAGFGMARLYAGSWSEWITDTNHPIQYKVGS
jgi:thiosulfate/3-mercaptopyruvate sulfurtransferase